MTRAAKNTPAPRTDAASEITARLTADGFDVAHERQRLTIDAGLSIEAAGSSSIVATRTGAEVLSDLDWLITTPAFLGGEQTFYLSRLAEVVHGELLQRIFSHDLTGQFAAAASELDHAFADDDADEDSISLVTRCVWLDRVRQEATAELPKAVERVAAAIASGGSVAAAAIALTNSGSFPAFELLLPPETLLSVAPLPPAKRFGRKLRQLAASGIQHSRKGRPRGASDTSGRTRRPKRDHLTAVARSKAPSEATKRGARRQKKRSD